MTEPRIYLVRSPDALLPEGLAGYGWKQVNFSQADNIDDLFQRFADKNINPGRHRAQIKRFFSINEGDIVVVPLYKSIAIGYATGVKSYAEGIGYGENRVGVEYLKHQNDTVIRIPRSHLSGALSARLRIRMSVVSLNEFREEILRVIAQVQTGGDTSISTRIKQLESEARSELSRKLLTNMQSGKTFLKSGGDGLERLVAELFETEGYDTAIFSKRAHPGHADADIEAIRADRFTSSKLLIQVKHHTGNTGLHAIKQLQELDTEDDTQCWVITTGQVAPDLIEQAESDGIGVMDGEQLAEWIIEQAEKLKPETRDMLGLSSLPMLLL